MKRFAAAALAFLALVLLAAPASAASFDCAKASTEIEHMICGDESLSKLDELLGDRYVRGLKKGDDPKAVKAAQRAWLRDTRDACPDAACLNAAYEARIADLTKIGWMTDEKARVICEEVVAAVNDGSIGERFAVLDRVTEEDRKTWARTRPELRHSLDGVLEIDYDSDGKVETLGKRLSGGSCYSDSIEDLALGYHPVLPPDDAQQRLRWAYWGYRSQFTETASEPIIVAANLRIEPRVTLVSWLGPDGGERPLCYLGSAGEMRVETIKNEDEQLCQAVIDGAVEYARWSPTQFSSDALWGMGVLPSSEVVEAAIDTDLDGNDNIILRMGYDSGAGCGSHLEVFREWDRAAELPANSKIGRFLAETWWGPMSRFSRPERWFSPDFFFFHGKPYMLGKGQFSRQTQVISFWGGDIHKWCEFDLLPEHRVEKFFPINTWPN